MKVTRKKCMCSDGGHAIKENFNLSFLILKVMNELRFTFTGGVMVMNSNQCPKIS